MTSLERLRLRTKEPDDAVLLDCLESAKNAILAVRFPYGDWPTRKVLQEDGAVKEETYVEARYEDLQYRIAIAIYNKSGGEFEVSHSENGVVRSFSSESIPQELLSEITPLAATVR